MTKFLCLDCSGSVFIDVKDWLLEDGTLNESASGTCNKCKTRWTAKQLRDDRQ